MTGTYEVRVATDSDAARLVGVIQAVYEEYGFVFDAEEETPDLLSLGDEYDQIGGIVFLAEQNGRVVGTVAVQLREGGCAELRRLYVLQGDRKAGIGRRLLDRAIEWVRETGTRAIFLWSDTRFERAHLVYKAAGFVRGGQRQLEDINQSLEFYFKKSL